MVLIKRITAYSLDRCGKYRSWRICYDGIEHSSDCQSGNATECEGRTKEQLISQAGRNNTVYFNGELVLDSGVAIDELNRQAAEAIAIWQTDNIQEVKDSITKQINYLQLDATWSSAEAYNTEAQELPAEIEAFNADLKTFLSGQATQPPGTTTQPAGTQPDKVAGLNPLISVALALAGVAAITVMAKVKT